MQGDKATRAAAIPFEALPAENGVFISLLNAGNFYLPPSFSTLSRIVPVVLSRPEAGQLIELRLNMRLFAANAGGFSLKIAIGKLGSDYRWDQAITQPEIDIMHKNITGRSTSYSAAAGGNLFIDDLDLLKAVPEQGETGYSSDAVVLLLCFDEIPLTSTGWELTEFRVHGSSQQGLV